jgi:peptide/nickel transport system permease protein
MAVKEIAQKEFIEQPAHMSERRRIVRVMVGRRIVVFGLAVIFITVIAAIFAPWLAPYDPNKPQLDIAFEGPSRAHLLGTDTLGRDNLSRIIFGTRASLIVGIGSVGVAAVVGIILGMIAGYYGGIVYMIIMRFMDSLMAFPMMLLALVVAALLGGGLLNIVIAIGVGMTAGYARLMCGQVLSVRVNDYIVAEKSIGASNSRIMFNHIFPNCFPPLIVMMTMMMGGAILAEAGLSFLGIGIKPPDAAWGAMVNTGYKYVLSDPLLSFIPGIAIMLVVFSFNMVGDGLRDALDPSLRGTI